MDLTLGELIQSGGAVALAVLVWTELRAFRKEVSDAGKEIAREIHKAGERQTVMNVRQRIIASAFGISFAEDETERATSNSEVTK